MSDEERLLRYEYAGSQVDDMLAAGPIRTQYEFDVPLVRLLKEIASRPRLARVYVSTSELELDLRSSRPMPAL